MAERRSFSNKVTGSDAFAELSFEAQALYMQLSMAADDDGFVSTPKKVQKSIGASDDAMDELEAEGYIITFDSGVCVISSWCVNNRITDSRKKRTSHVEEFSELILDEDGIYHKIEEEEKGVFSDGKSTAEGSAYKLHTNCMQTACKTPAPLFTPPSSPLLSSPHTPLYISPYYPPRLSPTPMSSSSLLYRARAQEIAVRYWGRKLKKFEKEELQLLSIGIAKAREGAEEGDVRLNDGDIELLDIAISASAKAGACSLSYVRGIYDNWMARGIYSPDDYWGSEAERDIISGKAFRCLGKIKEKGENVC